MFIKALFALPKSEVVLLKKISACMFQNDDQICIKSTPICTLFGGSRLFIEVASAKRMANPKSNQEAFLELLHLTHPENSGTTFLGQCALLLYMQREILKKLAVCKPCTDIGYWEGP